MSSVRISSADKLARIDNMLPALEALVTSCRLCGNLCEVDRTRAEPGICRASTTDGRSVRVGSATLHFGEEPMIVGRGGSGTVFLTHCNLRCVFCQNWQISQADQGSEHSSDALADAFLDLESRGAENINLVTPTHVIFPVVLGLRAAYERGLSLPVVYNTNGYDTVELLRLLEGVVDVYLPDLKYMDAAPARKYSKAREYPDVAKAALLEMVRQAEPMVLENGVARRGVILRHLVMPNNIAGSYDALLWLADEDLTGLTISLMSQYTPQNKAGRYPELAQAVPMREYEQIVDFALDLGFTNLLVQGLESRETGLPDFDRDQPFEWG